MSETSEPREETGRPPRGQMYSRFATDDELFDSPAEKERIMEDYAEEQARAMRHSGMV